MKEKILELRAKGYTYNQIRDELGCSKGLISYHVGPGQREKSIARNRKKSNLRRQHLIEVKSQAVCMDCGENYPHFMLDFDHRPGEDKRCNVAMVNMFSSLDQMIKEIAKCDIVCANCHRMRTYLRASKN